MDNTEHIECTNVILSIFYQNFQSIMMKPMIRNRLIFLPDQSFLRVRERSYNNGRHPSISVIEFLSSEEKL